MPLTDLIRYFNAADHRDDSLLYADGGRVAAWHRGLRLSSRFRPIVDLRRQRIVGHEASLLARCEDGTPVDTETAYSLHPQADEIVHFDRLCRTLHALNFLGQQRHAGGYLQMQVHPRHLRAVQNQHGLVYEAILKRCGLAPEDIVLSIDTTALRDPSTLLGPLDNYRRRGYRLALDWPADAQATGGILALQPDILRLAGPTLPALAAELHERTFLLEAGGIERGENLDTALINGLDLGTGLLFGDFDNDCRPTHSRGGVAYNLPSSSGTPP